MSAFLCLIADPGKAPLEPEMIAEAGLALDARARRLAAGEVCEFAIVDAAGAALDAPLRRSLEDVGVDMAVVPAAHPVKRLLVSDVGSTVIVVECLDQVAGALGIHAEVAVITCRVMNGELDFRSALAARVTLLAGLPVAALDDI
jgi:phosphoserine phosphatase